MKSVVQRLKINWGIEGFNNHERDALEVKYIETGVLQVDENYRIKACKKYY